MKKLLIGSAAMNGKIGYDVRVCRDTDIICDYDFFKHSVGAFKDSMSLSSCYPISDNKYIVKLKSGAIFEFEIAWGDGSSSDKILELETGIASLDMLYMLKMSHRYKKNSPHFLKTMSDIKLLRKEVGLEINPSLKEVYTLRKKETYVNKSPSLKQSKKDFFSGDNIDYIYDHDTIHLAVAELYMPAYSFIKEDIKEVEVSKELFFKSDWRTQLLTVVEESMVLAIERSLVPHPDVLTPEEAFDKALEKVCTSISSGWWREFAWENYDRAKEYFYYRRFKGWKYEQEFYKAVDLGLVKPFNN
tara:strand:- start:3817 stop:4722 length:906 start_codon:yes stop_codon:yes gene_type:complete